MDEERAGVTDPCIGYFPSGENAGKQSENGDGHPAGKAHDRGGAHRLYPGIRSQTDKLDFLFQALVKTSRLETGVIQLDKKPGRLFDTVAQAMSGIVYAAEKKEIAVSVDCPRI